MSSLSFQRSGHPRDLHSFPTRRSSDLYFGYFGAAAGEPGKGYYSFDLGAWHIIARSEEHTSELQSHSDLVCRLLLEKKKFQKFAGKNPVMSVQHTRTRFDDDSSHAGTM